LAEFEAIFGWQGDTRDRQIAEWDSRRRSGSTRQRPGKPTDNAFIEPFNGKFWAERLNAHWFMTLDDVRRKCEAWRRDYNKERPHRAIGK
jgi:putative transposase